MEDYKKKYYQALENIKKIKAANKDNKELVNFIEYEYPELAECEDERIRKEIARYFKNYSGCDGVSIKFPKWIAWLEKQKEQKEINLVEILKHYPIETELYSPLYGKLWLAEVNEEHGIITCYKYPPSEGDVRAILEQEDTVSFYFNGTTGLPDFNVSKDCMLFFYDNEKQGYQKPAWSEEDKKGLGDALWAIQQARTVAKDENEMGGLWYAEKWLKSLKERHTWKPSDEQLDALHDAAVYVDKSMFPYPKGILMKLYEQLNKLREE